MNNPERAPRTHGEITISIERAIERLRQERESFELSKKQASRWLVLRLVIGYSSIGVFLVVAVAALWTLTHYQNFPIFVVGGASSALFVDALGLVISVWKVVFNLNFYAPLTPVTREDTLRESTTADNPQSN
jgi:hypothetical protein